MGCAERMPRYYVLAKGTKPLATTNNFPYPYEVALCFDVVRRPIGFAEGVGHGSAGGVFTVSEALEPKWRGHFSNATGEWLLPILEELARGCMPAKDELLEAAATRLGHEPESYEVQLSIADPHVRGGDGE